MNALTVIIPVHREDTRFFRALDSAVWAQSILIIDQNSGIDWTNVQSKYNCVILPHPQLTDFSEMKNRAMKEAETEWVFFLDSDEYISPQLKSELLTQLEKNESDGFIVKRLDIFYGKQMRYGETKDANFLRIVKKNRAEWRGRVHEELVLREDSGKTVKISSPLFHEPHTSLSEFLTKINTYTSLLAQQPEKGIVIKSLLFPVGKFFYTFYIKLGFLDGYRGLIYSFFMSIHSSVVRIKRYEKNNH